MKVILVVLKPIKLLKLSATHRWPTTVMFPYKFLEVAGTAIEKKLNKFKLFFDVCSGSPVGRRQSKWSVSIKEFIVAGELPVGRRHLKVIWKPGLNEVGRGIGILAPTYSIGHSSPLIVFSHC